MATRPASIAPERLLFEAGEGRAGEPLYRRLYELLRQDILERRLRPGQRLAASRALARELGCSRNTVTAALDQLVAEGYLQARIGAGTFVALALPEEALRGSPCQGPRETGSGTERPRPSQRARHLLELVRPRLADAVDRRLAPFRPGLGDLTTFPAELWAKLASQVLRDAPPSHFDYGDPLGFGPLREALASYLREARGVVCQPRQIVVVAGSQQGLYLSARTLLDAGDRAWVEDPGYPGARAALLAAGIAAVPLPVDGEGLEVERGIELAAAARLAVVTPSHQYPLGVTMSLARRLQLLEWSHRNGAWIIEDDYDSEFRFEGRPIASLASLDPDGRVIYLGTLSKVLAPALRLGYMVVPESLLEAFVAARYALDRHGPNLEQAIAARFLDEGHFLRHLRRTRILYGQRQRALLSALHEYRDVLDAAPAPAGLHLLARLGGGWSEESAAAAARAQGISVHPLARYGAEWPQPPALVLGFAPFAEVAIARAAEQLGTALRKRT